MQQMLLAKMNSSLRVLGLVGFGFLYVMAQNNALSPSPTSLDNSLIYTWLLRK